MVQAGKNPSPEEPFREHNNADPADAGLEGVVEELRNVLSGLGNDAVEKTSSSETTTPGMENAFSFPPTEEPGNVFSSPQPTDSIPERSPLSEAPPPSDADFWNGNVLGWTDKEPSAPLPVNIAPIVETREVIEPTPVEPPPPPPVVPEKPAPVPEAESVNPHRSPAEELLPPLPPSPFDEEVKVVEPPAVPTSAHATQEPVMAPRVPVEEPSVRPPSIPPPISMPDERVEPAVAAQPIEENPAILEVPMHKKEGVVQIACIYPKGSEKQGQHFVSTLRTACTAAKLTIVIQPVFIQPWSSDNIDIPTWTKAAHDAGADRLFILAAKKDQPLVKDFASQVTKEGIPSRIVSLEHVGLRTLYADILVELRKTS
jgi:hypothetical protein